MKIYYLSQINTTTYSNQAINFISDSIVIKDITDNADLLSVSATAARRAEKR